MAAGRTLIVANSWPDADPDIRAIESRGHLIYFGPSFREMHRYAKKFVDDQEIYKFVGANLPFFESLDLRLYFKAGEMKATGVRTGDADGWKQYVRQQMMPVEKRVALNLMMDKTYGSDNQRAKEFARLTWAAPRTYYRYRDEIKLRQGEAA